MPYRAVEKYLGKEVLFEPQGYYESIGDDDEPLLHKFTGEAFISDTPELAASTYKGGAILGFYSMCNSNGKQPKQCFIYYIDETPDKDITHWDYQDFEQLKEVRYRRPVKGVFVKKFTYTPDMLKAFKSYYKIKASLGFDFDLEDLTEEEWNALQADYDKTLEVLETLKENKHTKRKKIIQQLLRELKKKGLLNQKAIKEYIEQFK